VNGVLLGYLTEEQCLAVDSIGLTVRQIMRVVGVPVETEHFKLKFLNEADNVESAELVRALLPLDDTQASFQILHLSAVSCMSQILRTVPPSITHEALSSFDALVQCALASIIAGDDAAATGPPTAEEIVNDPSFCRNHTYRGH